LYRTFYKKVFKSIKKLTPGRLMAASYRIQQRGQRPPAKV
jgi:hypothetical protein